MFHLQNRLIQAVGIIGADEHSGLCILKPNNNSTKFPRSTDLFSTNHSSAIFDYIYQPHLLATFSENTAIYPHCEPNIDPLYPPWEFQPNDRSSEYSRTDSEEFKPDAMLSSLTGGGGRNSKWKNVWRRRSSQLDVSRPMDKRRGSLARRVVKNDPTTSTSTSTSSSTNATTEKVHHRTTMPELAISAQTMEGLPHLLFSKGLQPSDKKFAPQLDYLVLSADCNRHYAMSLTLARPFRVKNQRKEDKFLLWSEEDKDSYLFEEMDENDDDGGGGLDENIVDGGNNNNGESSTTSSSGSGINNSIIYIPTSIVLISNQPYFAVMKQLISLLYRQVENCGEKFRSLIREFAACITNTLTSPNQGDVILEINISNQYFRIPPPNPVINRIIDFDLTILTKSLTTEDLLLIVMALMMQKRVVIVSDNPVLTTLFCEGLLLLLHPFEWHFPYVPWFPDSCLEFLGAIGSFLFGFHSKNVREILQSEDVICANLDNGEVKFSRNLPKCLPDPPKLAVKHLTDAMNELNKDYELTILCQLEPSTLEMMRENQFYFCRKYQNRMLYAFLKFHVDCFRSVLNFIQTGSTVYSGQSENLFKRELYLRAQNEAKEFYETIVKAEIFSTFLRGRFLSEPDAWARVELATRSMDLQSTPTATTTTTTASSSTLASPSSSSSSSSIITTNPFSLNKTTTMGPSFSLRRLHHNNLQLLHDTDSSNDDFIIHLIGCQNALYKYLRLPTYIVDPPRKYYPQLLETLSDYINATATNDIAMKTNLLFLRADCHLFLQNYMELFQDFYAILKLDYKFLQPQLIRHLIKQIDDEKIIENLKTEDYFVDLLQRLQIKLNRDQEKEDNLKIIQKLDKNIDPPSRSLSLTEFYNYCKLTEISYITEVQEALFQCLTLDQSTLPWHQREAPKEILCQFHDQWMENIYSIENEITKDLLSETEIILKLSPVIRVDNVGSGRLLMTQDRLLFSAVSTTSVLHLVWFKQMVGIERATQTTGFFNKQNTEMLKIKAFDSKLSRHVNSSVSYIAWLKEDTSDWYYFIKELWSAHISAVHQRDTGLITQAVDNCLILDTINNCAEEYNTTNHSGGTMMIPTGRNYFTRNKMKIQKIITTFTRMKEAGLHELPELTAQLLKIKIDPDATDIDSKCIEKILPILNNQTSRQEIWCLANGGFGGKVIILDGSPLKLIKVVLKRTTKLLSMEQCGEHVWIGDSEGNVFVVRSSTRKVERQMKEHKPCYENDPILVQHITSIYALPNSGLVSKVLSATSNGDVIIWNANTKETWYCWQIGGNVRLKGVEFCGEGLIACAVRNALRIYPVNGSTLPLAEFTPTLPKELIPFPSLASIFVLPGKPDERAKVFQYSIYVSHGSNSMIHLLYLEESRGPLNNVVAATLVEEKNKVITHLCNIREEPCQQCQGSVTDPCIRCRKIMCCHGISKLLLVESQLWAPCKDGNIFIMRMDLGGDPSCVQAHRGPVESICMTNENIVLTGGRSDNRLALWNCKAPGQ